MRRIAGTLAVLGLLVGGCSSDPTASEEYKELEGQLTVIQQHLDDVTVERDALAEEMAADAERVAVVEANEAAYIEAFFAKDLDAFMATFADDAVFVDETFGDYFEGKGAVEDMYRFVITFADPALTEVVDLFVADDGAFAASTWEWIGTNFNGNPFDLPLTLIHEYRDGKIVREIIYYASPNAVAGLRG